MELQNGGVVNVAYASDVGDEVRGARLDAEPGRLTSSVPDDENNTNKSLADLDDKHHQCSLFGLVPLPCLKPFLTAKFILFFISWGAIIQGLVVNGIVNVNISTLEKRFGLQSTQTGVIAGCYDIGSMLAVIPISYFGGRLGASKPKYIAIGLLVMGTGSLVFSLPHFLTGRYNNNDFDDDNDNDSKLCSSTALLEPECSKPRAPDRGSLSNYRYFFVAAQVLHGIGAAPLITLGTTLLDESVSKTNSPLYIGIFQTTFVIGPALGFVLGGQFLKLHTDIDVLEKEVSPDITPTSQLWVGAWWMGFIVAWLSSWACAFFIGLYPAVIPGAGKHNQISPSDGFGSLKQLPSALKALFKNPTFILINFGGAMDGFSIACMATFMPKYFQFQFNFPSSLAAMIVGLLVVPAGGGGTFFGGFLSKRLRLTRSGVIKLWIFCQIFTIPGVFGFFFNCPTSDFFGVSIGVDGNLPQLDSTCNSGCSCSRYDFNPVCGDDGVTYFNPCFAGCINQITEDSNITYSECSCLVTPAQQAVPNSCSQSCSASLPGFIIAGIITIFFTFMSAMPSVVATLRSVEPVHRSLGLGIESIFTRILGTIPGPIILGYYLDKACLLWQDLPCDDNVGNCLFYNNFDMAMAFMVLLLIVKFLGVIFFGLALFFSQRSHIPDAIDD